MGRSEPPAWHAPFHELNDAGMLDLEPPEGDITGVPRTQVLL